MRNFEGWCLETCLYLLRSVVEEGATRDFPTVLSSLAHVQDICSVVTGSPVPSSMPLCIPRIRIN